MQSRINIVTLGVKDLTISRTFYEKGLGWKISSASNEHFVAFHMNGVTLCLFSEEALAEDAAVQMQSKGFRGITLAQNVGSKKEVDDALKKAVKAGATLTKPAQDVFWGGYSCYFADPDGHLWEIAWNPHWTLKEDGTLQLPE